MRKMWLVILLLGLAFIGSYCFRSWSEPRYRGRQLSHWLAIYHDTAPPRWSPPDFRLSIRAQQAFDAVKCIGTNAVPNLLKWTACEDKRSTRFQLRSGIYQSRWFG